jgi:hypothetical protein
MCIADVRNYCIAIISTLKNGPRFVLDMITKYPTPILPEPEPSHPDHYKAHGAVQCS